jgi:hypothetical protein
MRIEGVVIFERKDLFLDYKNKNFLDISFTDIRQPRELFDRACLVLFIDNDGETKILKNKYGNTN